MESENRSSVWLVADQRFMMVKGFLMVKFLVNGQVLTSELGLTITVVVNSIASKGCMVSNSRTM